jgi:hypothetical protein
VVEEVKQEIVIDVEMSRNEVPLNMSENQLYQASEFMNEARRDTDQIQ